jgi:hypothetical protein
MSLPRTLGQRRDLMLEPEGAPSDANEIEKSDADYEADNGGPDFERKIHEPQIE